MNTDSHGFFLIYPCPSVFVRVHFLVHTAETGILKLPHTLVTAVCHNSIRNSSNRRM